MDRQGPNVFRQERVMDTKKIEAFINEKLNIASSLKDEQLTKIGALVKKGYDVDLESRSEIDEINKEAMKLAKQVLEKKSFPWPDAASVKYPLITVASIQFASRALPELVPDENIVNPKIVGEDEDGAKEERGDRITKYMNHQLTTEMESWMDETDRLLHTLPVTGTCFRKVYYDPMAGHVVSKYLSYDDVVVNAKAANLKSARRVSHKFYRHKNVYQELVNAGIWREIELGTATDGEADDEDAPHLFIEQHRWLDLDDDGYEEPYIVTIHAESSEVVRVMARYDADSLILKAGKLIRIHPIQYFIKYPFIPNPDGGFYDIGFGTLLYPINGSINSTINQLLDSGTLANTGGGFLSRGVKMSAGSVMFKPGEWKQTDSIGQDLRQGIMPLPVKEPSQVLFQLLGLLISAGRDISSVQEAMSGNKPGENVSAATVTALIEQGLKVFSGIYKRIYRSLTEEFKLIFRLNSVYLDQQTYVKVLDTKVMKDDFSLDSFDIAPAAEPVFSLDAQRVGRAEALLKISGRKGLNEDEVTKSYLKSVRAPEKMFLPPDKRPPQPPDPKIEEVKIKQGHLDLAQGEARLKNLKLFAEIEELRARAINYIAKAEAEGQGPQLQEYKLFIDELGMTLEAMKNEGDDKRGVPGVEAGPQN
jgi:chaperonin GroES